MKSVAENRRARFDVAVENTYEAGIVLTGDEIKSVRAKRIQLTGAYVKLLRGKGVLPQAVLVGAHLSMAAEPERSRPLLLHAKEVRELEEALTAKGKTAVPLSLHMKHGWAKLVVGVGPGRKNHDKRELIKSRDLDREERAVGKRAR